MVHPDDDLDITKHGARETLMEQYANTFGLSRRQVFEDFVAHAENDPDSPVFAQRGTPRRKSARRAIAEVLAREVDA